jgi:hypothetical protein
MPRRPKRSSDSLLDNDSSSTTSTGSSSCSTRTGQVNDGTDQQKMKRGAPPPPRLVRRRTPNSDLIVQAASGPINDSPSFSIAATASTNATLSPGHAVHRRSDAASAAIPSDSGHYSRRGQPPQVFWFL